MTRWEIMRHGPPYYSYKQEHYLVYIVTKPPGIRFQIGSVTSPTDRLTWVCHSSEVDKHLYTCYTFKHKEDKPT